MSLGSSIDGYVESGGTVYANQAGATGYAGTCLACPALKCGRSGKADSIIVLYRPGRGATAIATNTIIEQGVIILVDGGIGTVSGAAGGNTAFVYEGGSLSALQGGVATVNNGGVARVSRFVHSCQELVLA